MKNLLQTTGLKATKSRVLLLEYLSRIKKPVSITELLADRHIAQSMNQTTIYRSLNQMVEAGLIYKTHFDTESAKYEWQDSHHHHLTCVDCGYQEAVQECLVSGWEPSISSEFEKVTRHVVELFGLCKKCNTNN